LDLFYPPELGSLSIDILDQFHIKRMIPILDVDDGERFGLKYMNLEVSQQIF
jgi:hypothetical protein